MAIVLEKCLKISSLDFDSCWRTSLLRISDSVLIIFIWKVFRTSGSDTVSSPKAQHALLQTRIRFRSSSLSMSNFYSAYFIISISMDANSVILLASTKSGMSGRMSMKLARASYTTIKWLVYESRWHGRRNTLKQTIKKSRILESSNRSF